MTPERLAELERHQTTTAKKVLAALPMEGSVATHQVMAQLNAQGHSPGHNIVMGCLRTLAEDGLIRETVSRGTTVWERVKAKPRAAAPMTDIPKPQPATPPSAPAPKLDAAALIGPLAAMLRELADQLDKTALELDDARNTDRAQLEKLLQLKSLLRDIA